VARTTTAGTGQYRLALPTGGAYLLICSAPGHQPFASMVTVAAGEVRRDVNLTAAGRLLGRVVGPSGDPVTGATVTLTDATGQVIAAAVSDAAGAYLFADLHPGDYTLVAGADDRRPVAQGVTVDTTGSRSVDVVLHPNGTIGGIVRAATSGRTLGEASVTLIDADGNVAAAAVTNDDGRYEFADLRPGSYLLTASGYAPVVARVEVGADGLDRHDVLLGLSDSTVTNGAGTNGAASNDLRRDGLQPDGSGPDGAGSDGAGSDGAGSDGAGSDGAGSDGAGSGGAGSARSNGALPGRRTSQER
jgi:hypothetical protein